MTILAKSSGARQRICSAVCATTLIVFFSQNHLTAQSNSLNSSNSSNSSNAPSATISTLSQARDLARARAAGPPVRRVNAPFVDAATIDDSQTAVFWFGRVTRAENYVDVRVGYNRTALSLQANVFDRRVWHDDNAAHNSFAELTQWDAVVFYLDTGTGSGSLPANTTYRFVAQLNWPNDQAKFQIAARGNGANWAELGTSLPFTATSVWRGGPNDETDDRGWWLNLLIPFKSLGLAAMPQQGALWRLGVQLFDRDDTAGAPIPTQFWPESFQPDAPNTWGQLALGWPNQSHGTAPSVSTLTVRNGLNGSVMDAPAGGGTVCADPYLDDYFTGFGQANYAQADYFNVQNQGDVADWPCFSKFYITFPLTAVPPNLSVISATLTAVQFGNSGQGGPPEPAPDWSLIHVFTTNEDWQDTTLTWNNAPYASENLSRAWVAPVKLPPPVPSVPITWDVTEAVDEAYRTGQPLRLVVYSADGARNSGKYFWTSDMRDDVLRPSLTIALGAAGSNPTTTPVPLPTPGNLDKHNYLPFCMRD